MDDVNAVGAKEDDGQDNYEILFDSGAYAYVVPRMMVKNCLASGQLAERFRSTTGKQIQKWDEKTPMGEVFDESTTRRAALSGAEINDADHSVHADPGSARLFESSEATVVKMKEATAEAEKQEK